MILSICSNFYTSNISTMFQRTTPETKVQENNFTNNLSENSNIDIVSDKPTNKYKDFYEKMRYVVYCYTGGDSSSGESGGPTTLESYQNRVSKFMKNEFDNSEGVNEFLKTVDWETDFDIYYNKGGCTTIEELNEIQKAGFKSKEQLMSMTQFQALYFSSNVDENASIFSGIGVSMWDIVHNALTSDMIEYCKDSNILMNDVEKMASATKKFFGKYLDAEKSERFNFYIDKYLESIKEDDKKSAKNAMEDEILESLKESAEADDTDDQDSSENFDSQINETNSISMQINQQLAQIIYA